jgi:hypothetical protein
MQLRELDAEKESYQYIFIDSCDITITFLPAFLQVHAMTCFVFP